VVAEPDTHAPRAAALRSPALLAALLDAIADGVYLVDPEGRVSFVNPAALAILGYDEERELLGRASHATIHHTRPDGTAYPEDECPLLRPRSTGEVVRVDLDRFVRRDGSLVPVAYSSAPLALPEGRGAVVVFADVTERLAGAAAERRELAERARADALGASRARIVASADAARHRLARDIHDGAQQQLVLGLLQLEQARLALAADPATAARHLDAAARTHRDAIAELRRLATGIHPPALRERGLAAALEELTARAPFVVAVDVPAARFPDPVELAAYFVCAEALANAAKHAHATRARVEARTDGGELVLVIADDGVGGADPAAGSGLRGLEDRAAALGGSLTVASPDGGGTRVEARLPLGAP
jgi:PAS domain S-box-containing protein